MQFITRTRGDSKASRKPCRNSSLEPLIYIQICKGQQRARRPNFATIAVLAVRAAQLSIPANASAHLAPLQRLSFENTRLVRLYPPPGRGHRRVCHRLWGRPAQRGHPRLHRPFGKSLLLLRPQRRQTACRLARLHPKLGAVHGEHEAGLGQPEIRGERVERGFAGHAPDLGAKPGGRAVMSGI